LRSLVGKGEVVSFVEDAGAWLMLVVESCIVDVLFNAGSSVVDLVCHRIALEHERHLCPGVDLLPWELDP